MLGPIHAFGSGCFYVFGVLYLVFIHSSYLFFSNAVFGTLGILNWFLLRGRFAEHVRAASFLVIVYAGLVNVAVHLGREPMPMVMWGMSVTIAAAFLFGRNGVAVWTGLTLLFYPLVEILKTGPLAQRVIELDPFQTELLAVATYGGLLFFLAYSFFQFRSRLGVMVDDLRAHAAALRKSESFLVESQQAARVGSFDLSLPAGTWTSSPVLDQILGIDASYRRDIPGWLALLHPEDREAWRDHARNELMTGSVALDRACRLAREDRGEHVWVHGRGVVQCGADGAPVRLMGTLQDISGSRRAEEERRLLEGRLFQAQKLESLGVLAGGIAHDFNNLLTVILGNINLAQGHAAAGQANLAGFLGHAETAALRAAELTRQMLAFAGRGQLVVQPLDINAALAEMAELLKTSVSKKIEVRLELAASAPEVVADASQIRQIFMNLILNAAEAIGDAPGFITVRTDVRSDRAMPSPTYSSPAANVGCHVCVEVVDTGCGMDEATQARIFEPFFTTKFTGRGLGLAAVLGIVKGHGGAIALASSPAQGTTFTVLFPCAPGNTQA
jgi:signal transduction histidine kinase